MSYRCGYTLFLVSHLQELYKGMFIYWKMGVSSYGFYDYYIG